MSSYLKESEKVSYLRSKPIRVMHLVDKLSVSGSGVHGVTKAIERWIHHFDRQQFHFCVCSLRSPELAGEIFSKQGITVDFLSMGKFDPRTLTKLLALIERENPQIIHSHGYGSNNFGRLASLLTGIPNIVHEHAVLPNQPFYQTIADIVLSPLATKAIAVSESVREFMIHSRKVRPEKLETIIIGIPLTEFHAPEPSEVQKQREQLGICSDDYVVSTVGRLDKQKGQVYFLKSAVSILRELPQTKFLIVGDGPDLLMLKSLAQKLGIAERVIFTGFRNDVATLLTMSNVVAMPSLWEGLPLTLLEAMNLSKPVVGTPAAGMKDVIRDGETGFLVPFRNADLLAKKIVYLLKNPRLANIMGEKAVKNCHNYDISQSVKRLSEIYRDLVA